MQPTLQAEHNSTDKKRSILRGVVTGVLIGITLGAVGGYLIKTVPFLYDHKDWASPILIGLICAVVTVVNLAWRLPEGESKESELVMAWWRA